jgi:hypothetical protein
MTPMTSETKGVKLDTAATVSFVFFKMLFAETNVVSINVEPSSDNFTTSSIAELTDLVTPLTDSLKMMVKRIPPRQQAL